MHDLWSEKFAPRELLGFIGNSDVKQACIKWGEAWEQGVLQKPLLLYGQSGVGKTLLAYLVANHFGWQLFELSGSDFRDKQTVESIVGSASVNSTLFGSKRLVLLDEIDCLTELDRGGAQAIVQILRTSKNPVILTANDVYSGKKLSLIRPLCSLIEFKKINYLSIARHLREILVREKILFDENAVLEIAKKCEGDLRAALLDLQAIASQGSISLQSTGFLGERERSKKIFSVMAKIFHGKNFEELKSEVFFSDASHEMLVNWVEENIPLQLHGLDVGKAFDFLSKADRFDGRIFSRQYFGFLRYSSDLISIGVNLSNSRQSVSFVPFRFPSLLSKLSRSLREREAKKELSRKVGKKIHCSARKTMTHFLPFVQVFLKDKNAIRPFVREFDLSAQELGFLLELKPDSKKVLQFFQDSSGKKIKKQKLESMQENHSANESKNGQVRQTTLF